MKSIPELEAIVHDIISHPGRASEEIDLSISDLEWISDYLKKFGFGLQADPVPTKQQKSIWKAINAPIEPVIRHDHRHFLIAN
jgi:hypothetical protein